MKCHILVFVSVGIGYPLRFFLGLLVILPIEYVMQYWYIYMCLAGALWAYGSFSSILAWVNEVTERMQASRDANNSFSEKYLKSYYEDLQKSIVERFIDAEGHKKQGRVLPLREKCSFKDVWNIAFLITLTLMGFSIYLNKMDLISCFIEVVVFVLLLFNISLKHVCKLISFVLVWGIIIVKILLALMIYKLPIEYSLLSVMQFIIVFTYFLLTYRPQKVDINKLIKLSVKNILGWMLGKKALDMMLPKNGTQVKEK